MLGFADDAQAAGSANGLNVTVDLPAEGNGVTDPGFFINGGVWSDFGTVTVTNGAFTLADTASVSGDKLDVQASGTAAINGTAEFNEFTTVTGSAVTVGGALTIVGTEGENAGVSIAADTVTVNGSLSLESNVAGLIADAIDNTAEEGEQVTLGENLGTIKVNASTGTVNVAFDSDTKLSSSVINEIKQELFGAEEGSESQLGVVWGNATLEDVTIGDDNEITIDELVNSSANDGNSTTDLTQTTVTASAGQTIGNNTTNAIVGSISVADQDAEQAVTIAGDWSLNGAASNTATSGSETDAFIANSDGEVLDIDYAGSNLALNNGGVIGSINVTNENGAIISTSGDGVAQTGTITNANGAVNINGQTEVTGSITAQTLAVTNALTVSGEGEDDGAVSVDSLSAAGTAAQLTVSSITAAGAVALTEGASLSAETVSGDSLQLTSSAVTADNVTVKTVNTASGSNLTVADTLTIGGDTSATEAAVSTIDGGTHTIENLTIRANATSSEEGAEIVDQNLNINGEATLNVGTLTGAAGAVILTGSDNAENSSSATLVAQTVAFNGGLFIADPDFTQAYSKNVFVTVDSDTAAEGTDWIIDGKDGKVGGAVSAQNAVTGIGVTEDELIDIASNYTVANGALDQNGVASLMIIGHKVKLAEDAVLAAANVDGSEIVSSLGLTGNMVYLGEGSAFYFTQNAAEVTTTDQDAAITFTSEEGGTVVADNGKIIIGGDIAADTQISLFANANTDTPVKITVGANNTDETLEISTANGLLGTTIDLSDANIDNVDLSDIELEISDSARSVLSGLSAPMFDTVMAAYNDSSLHGAGVSYIRTAAGQGNGSNIEATARMATFGGALQAGYLASQTTSDMIESRVGGSPVFGKMIASDVDGTGVWLAPVYRHQESDSFDADGVDYGADIDLYGVAFGIDRTADGFRYGVMFNVGSGDADGQGAGSSVSNDFDYYSLAAYAGIKQDGFGVIADLSYTETDNDLDQNTGVDGFGTLTAQTDVSVLSMGVKGEYTFETAVMNITPHVGVRYSRVEMDDYSVKNGGSVIADVDADDMNVISIPFGVTLDADFAVGAWTLSPSFDVTLTANTGDTDQDSYTVFSGADFGTALNAEFLDDFTYGATLGFDAQYGQNFNMGINVGYVGSDNTDEIGVGASLRYCF